MAFPLLINGGDPNYLLRGMILQLLFAGRDLVSWGVQPPLGTILGPFGVSGLELILYSRGEVIVTIVRFVGLFHLPVYGTGRIQPTNIGVIIIPGSQRPLKKSCPGIVDYKSLLKQWSFPKHY